MFRKLMRACLLLALFTTLPSALPAQYFGRQKVQYEDFDWRIMKSQHFDVHYYPEEEEVVEDATRMAERWYTRLSRAFQHEFKKKPLILYADHPDFQQTNVIGDQLTEGTGGVTEGIRTRVIMPFTGIYRDNDHVLGHELVHVFQYDLAASPAGGGLSGMGRLPLWLVEGMAEYLSLGRVDAHTAMWLRDAALRGELPTIDQLTRDPRFFPYRYGQALWAYIAGRWGDRSVTELYRFATRTGWDVALQRVLGLNSKQLSEQWITAIRSQYLPLIAGRQRPQDAGDRVLYDDEIGAFNLSPVLSPDGRYVAYFTREGLFSIDLYVADARTGETVKKLTSPNRTPHFDALSFISSAGTWSPDGQKFAFAVFDEGDMRIAIFDVNSEDVEREISIAEVGAIANPAWSPDGSRIAVTGMQGGASDLYIIDVATGSAQQITNDRYADLQPAWSPDGRSIAFSTDRGAATDFQRMVFGPMNLAIFDLATNEVRVIAPFAGAKHINPQYSPSGRELYFIADHEGFSDLFRLDIATGSVNQVTRLATGVSGITALSPALTVAQRSGRVMFSVFENTGYNVYGLDPERAVGTPVQTAPEADVVAAAILPPMSAYGTGLVAEYLSEPLVGLPPASAQFAREDYRPRLMLDYLGQPSVGVGASRFGPSVGGGVSAYFSDMLGDHQLGAAIQAQGTLKDIGGQAFYRNSEHRWNWATLAGHIPYLTAQTFVSQDPATGQQLVQQFLERIYVDQLAGFAYRPFSQTRRIEFSGGFTRLAFDREVRSFLVQGGVVVDEQREDDPFGEPEPLYFFDASAAYVGDNSNFGFTSPVVGQRYRLEVSPTFGTLQYQTGLLDYRRYFFAQPISFAFRGMHYGRYGRDGDNERLTPLFLGYETFVRGYSVESFEASECSRPTRLTGTTECPEFERLVGSRLAVANFEIRIPLFGVPGLGLINMPFLPTEIAPFFDAGLAWWGSDAQITLANGTTVRRERPRLAFDRDTPSRVPVFSTGVSARMNILGYLILEAYYAYPFQRREKGGHFGFNIAPGW
ncbi:MAG: peptidase S9 [Gemmatimonadota bacterium]